MTLSQNPRQNIQNSLSHSCRLTTGMKQIMTPSNREEHLVSSMFYVGSFPPAKSYGRRNASSWELTSFTRYFKPQPKIWRIKFLQMSEKIWKSHSSLLDTLQLFSWVDWCHFTTFFSYQDIFKLNELWCQMYFSILLNY